MGVVLFVACVVCCLAGIGFNSKRRKRERENALAWDRVSESLSEGGSAANLVPLASIGSPLQSEETSWASVFPTALFGARLGATTTTTTTTTTVLDAGGLGDGAFAAGSTASYQDSMWPGAVKKDDGYSKLLPADEASSDAYASMWPGSSKGKDGKANLIGGTTVSDADATWLGPQQGKRDSVRGAAMAGDKTSSGPTLASTVDGSGPVAAQVSVDYGSADAWSLSGMVADVAESINGVLFAEAEVEGAAPIAPVTLVASTEEETEEFHF
jgi:hypothetical protein